MSARDMSAMFTKRRKVSFAAAWFFSRG